ncbi:M48 family metallopeptidase [Crocosphaera sp. UHCC 0190]|uniref:M48 family metallopeptidase n=1 Tax=Crocosphaera sp. UHCC 0190 TaxID=3110246 RepID=UPI002B20E8F3|nr:M48 family metallopeptidase [Crocosphaera sp. UHCC 0190]MEA5510739.1 M48 family metallopeptidase [Crocosphaera sp. UHCC 0190]
MMKLPRFYRRSLAYSLLTVVFSSLIIISTPQPGYSQSWLNWIFQGVQVIQLSTLSDSQEVKYGQQINQELLKSGQFTPSRNRELTQRIERIGYRLAKNSSRSNLPFTFQVVNDNAINAFATMGGFVYINTGTIAAADNEAELASVIAHEIGHITERHSIKQMRNVAVSQGLMSAAGLNENDIVNLGVQLAVNLPNSREAELEADQAGLKNLERAGYAPIGMITFMKKLTQNGGATPEFLSTHPATPQRVSALTKAVNPQTASQGDGLNNQAYQQQFRALL